MSKLQIVIALYPGVTHLDFTGPHQVLSRLPNADLAVASMGGIDIEAEGLTFTNLADLAAIERCDVLCVPGGLGTTDAMLDEAFMAQIRRLGAGAKYLTSVCTGSLILAAAGFLKGKRAACHWAWRDLLVPFGVIVDDGRVVRDGDIITGGGVTAGLDFAFVLVAELAGETFAKSIQLGLEYAPSPPFASGRPELASPEILAAVKARMEPFAQSRLAAVQQVAARLEAAQ
ncbi:thiamine biosynthesis protein ThiJ [Phenylobacterium sp. Root77]|uniref:DJ-1/PfpI family protein n=1 Tax=unclassified Phenylobacterium TaxID=2640670 RepID=UPI0006F88744|nr:MULTISPECIES: DJ-1/PfpI family protein [unclassified Phenylobacterium]KQW68214.1 thiamine biosynthesis protein ThiJ [Phenylobacterium sp. Root1277]KQW91955.1 thiamine biosynthesis protein ThiJ [Phenylobacterium sp. Root1290]KRC40187.1 thiamine biosynthesis protein ThiJ [Phenylobacterium sp. Root77]